MSSPFGPWRSGWTGWAVEADAQAAVRPPTPVGVRTYAHAGGLERRDRGSGCGRPRRPDRASGAIGEAIDLSSPRTGLLR
jgi:hypothetical protein